MKLINYPIKIDSSEYEDLTAQIASSIHRTGLAVSIYQMGSVKDPGISDLDLICVFKKEVATAHNLRETLGPREKLILTHGIFGCNEDNLDRALQFGYFSNLKLICGKDLNLDKRGNTTSNVIKRQIALEYLVKMYITLEVQLNFGVVKLRSFLLLAKALKFDLELLDISSGNLYDQINTVLFWRKNWFNNRPSDREVKKFIREFHSNLESLLSDILNKEDFYLPKEKVQLPGNINIVYGDYLQSKRQGILLPKVLMHLTNKYLNMLYRLNKFYVTIPFALSNENSEIKRRFNFYKDYVAYNEEHYPYFVPLTSSLPTV